MSRKKFSIPTSALKKLKREVSRALGRKIDTHRDCEILSENIELRTGKRIGITTIRRIFDLDTSKNLPSKHTLDTLSVFCGYNSWDTFQKNKSPSESSATLESIPINKILEELIGWESIKEKSDHLSEYTLNAIKKKSGIPYHKTVEREFANRYIINFLNSNKTAMAFIAPGGFGKTIMIAKAVEKLWLNTTPLFPNDIIWFIDANILSGFKNTHFDYLDWLLSQTGLGNEPDYRNYFLQHPSERKARMILIIDSVDDITTNPANLENFFKAFSSIISTNDDTPWFKIILTMRNQAWEKHVSLFKDYTEIQSLWFGVSFDMTKKHFRNVPYLSQDEIELFIKNFRGEIKDNVFEEFKDFIISSDYRYIISDPYFLQVFVASFIKSGIVPKSDTELLIEFYKKLITGGIYGEQKQEIIEILLDSTEDLLRDKRIPKKKLLGRNHFRDIGKAYEELISYGILSESQHYNKFGTLTTFVRFTQDNLLYFLQAKRIIEKYFRFDIYHIDKTEPLFKDKVFKIEIIKWIVNFLFFLEEYELIFNLKDYLSSRTETYKEMLEVISIMGKNIRHNDNAMYQLYPKIASDKQWQRMYLEEYLTIDKIKKYFPGKIRNYFTFSNNPDFNIYGHSLLFVSELLDMNKIALKKQLIIINNILDSDAHIHPIYLGYAYAVKVFYNYFFEQVPDKTFLIEICHLEKDVFEHYQSHNNLPLFYVFFMAAAILFEDYFIIKRLHEEKLPHILNNMENEERAEYSLLNLMAAHGLIMSGEIDKVKEKLDIYSRHFNKDLRVHFDAYYYYVEAKYYLASGNPSQADRYLHKALNQARKTKIKMFELFIKNRIEVMDSH